MLFGLDVVLDNISNQLYLIRLGANGHTRPFLIY
jgi:hypothetical protein